MQYQYEVVVAILSIALAIFVVIKLKDFKTVYAYKFLLLAFASLIVGFLATVLEEFFLGDILNYVEHISYLVAAILTAVWSWRLTKIIGE